MKHNISTLLHVARLIRRDTTGRVIHTDGAGNAWAATKLCGHWRIICNGEFVANRVSA